MPIKPLLAGLAAALAMASATATQTLDTTGYTVSYDDTSIFGQATVLQGNGTPGFRWTIPTAVGVSTSGSFVMEEFVLPAFTITLKPGYTASSVSLFLGNLAYSERDSPFSSSGAIPDLYLETTLEGSLGQQFTPGIDKVETSSNPNGTVRGGHVVSSTLLQDGPFGSAGLGYGLLILRANANAGGSASLGSDGQDQLRIELNLAPVPEPGTSAMLLAGLVTLGALVRRRRRG